MQHTKFSNPAIRLPTRKIYAFCRRWQVAELALFGSVLTAEFNTDSDIDVLVTFAEGEQWSLFDLLHMQEQLEEIFQRPVDLVERDAIRNPFRQRAISKNMQVIYAA